MNARRTKELEWNLIWNLINKMINYFVFRFCEFYTRVLFPGVTPFYVYILNVF